MDSGARSSNFHHLSLLFNLLQGIQLAFAAAGADRAGVIPVGLGFQIGIPKRPRTALPGAGGIDGAFAGRQVKEDTGPVGKLLEAFSRPHAADIFVLEGLGVAIFHQSRQSGDLLVVHPHIPRRARAAIAALRAGELETFVIPGKFFGHRDSLLLARIVASSRESFQPSRKAKWAACLKDNTGPEKDRIARLESASGKIGDAAAKDVTGFHHVAGAAVELPLDAEQNSEVLERHLVMPTASPLDGLSIAAVFRGRINPILEA